MRGRSTDSRDWFWAERKWCDDILFCGRINAKARVELLVKAVYALKASGKTRVRAKIIGDGQHLSSLQELAERLGVADWISWLGPIFDEEALAKHFLNASVFVYPGAVGLSAIHAMHYGLPVVTHDQERDQMPEAAAVRHRETGIRFGAGDYTDLAAKLEGVLADREMLQKLSSSALSLVRAKHSVRLAAQELIGAAASARLHKGL
jgi:glycosyltransferase involved in cell wall biosynthesis